MFDSKLEEKGIKINGNLIFLVKCYQKNKLAYTTLEAQRICMFIFLSIFIFNIFWVVKKQKTNFGSELIFMILEVGEGGVF